MSRILLTGASGLIGAHTLRRLLNGTGHHVVCPVTFRHKGLPARLDWASDGDWNPTRATVVRCDLAAPIDPVSAYTFGDVDVIINFASDTHTTRSVEQPVPTIRNNVDTMLYLLEYARTLPKLRVFIHISTNAVYGAVSPHQTCTEWDPINPDNPYSASKAAQEAIGISYWRSYGVPLVLVNTMNPIGETQDPEKFIPMTIGKILRGDPVLIHAEPNGKIGRRAYIDAGDVADALQWVIRRTPTPFSPETTRPDRWNVCGETELDNLAVAEIIAKALDESLSYTLTTARNYSSRYALSGAKLARAGWTPATTTGINDSIRRIARWTADETAWVKL